MAEVGVRLSSLWAFECPSHDHIDMGGGCLHPGYPPAQPFTAEVITLAAAASRALQGLPPRQFNMTLVWLPEPKRVANANATATAEGGGGEGGRAAAAIAEDEPACLDGSRYGYYALPGRVNKWLVMLQGGGCE